MNKTNKSTKTERVLGYILSGVALTAAVIFMMLLHFVNLIPTGYKVLIGLALLLMIADFAIFQWFKIPGWITKVLSVLLTVVLIWGSVMVYKTHATISKISGDNTMITTVNIYVAKDSGVTELSQLTGKTSGILEKLDRENSDKMLSHILNDKGVKISFRGYDGVAHLLDALYEGEVDFICINSAYTGLLTDTEGYADFEEKVRMIYSKEFVTEIETEMPTIGEPSTGGENETQGSGDKETEPETPMWSGDSTITFYISGIDSYGPPTTVSRSDVNILCVINKKTHQVLLLSTPRDYYVPLTVSHGEGDKLTHAGIYGINCSIGTLEMLYGIKVDHYVKVNFTGFTSIIDALGGIDVDSPYEFTTYHQGFHFVKGINHLDGEHALAFARERYNLPGGDRSRGRNHMIVIEALINKLASSALIANYTSVLESLSNSMVTSMSHDEIGDLVKFQLEETPKWEIMQFSVDGTGATSTTFSMNEPLWVMIPNMDTVNKAKEYFRMIYFNEMLPIE